MLLIWVHICSQLSLEAAVRGSSFAVLEVAVGDVRLAVSDEGAHAPHNATHRALYDPAFWTHWPDAQTLCTA